MADTETSTGTILDISQQLDLLIVEYFQSLAEIFKYKQLLENDIKEGFFYMAKVTVVKFYSAVSDVALYFTILGRVTNLSTSCIYVCYVLKQ